MSATGPAVGRTFIAAYKLTTRARRKAFSLMASGGFASFGRRSVIAPPVRLNGASRIAIGDGVFVGPGSWLHVDGEGDSVAIEFGDGTSLGAYSAVTAVESVRIGRRVLTARGIYISDHSHAFDDPTRPVRDQGLTKIAPVEIGDGVWLGEGVVVCPGVRIGASAVIGANSVVTTDIPSGAVAVGAPARVVRVRGNDAA